MRAIVMSEHGGPEVLRLVDRPVPAPQPVRRSFVSRPSR